MDANELRLRLQREKEEREAKEAAKQTKPGPVIPEPETTPQKEEPKPEQAPLPEPKRPEPVTKPAYEPDPIQEPSQEPAGTQRPGLDEPQHTNRNGDLEGKSKQETNSEQKTASDDENASVPDVRTTAEEDQDHDHDPKTEVVAVNDAKPMQPVAENASAPDKTEVRDSSADANTSPDSQLQLPAYQPDEETQPDAELQFGYSGGKAPAKPVEPPPSAEEMNLPSGKKVKTVPRSMFADAAVLRDFPKSLVHDAKALFPDATNQSYAVAAYLWVLSDRTADVPEVIQKLANTYKGDSEKILLQNELNQMRQELASTKKTIAELTETLRELELGIGYLIFDAVGMRNSNPSNAMNIDLTERNEQGSTMDVIARMRRQSRMTMQLEQERRGRTINDMRNLNRDRSGIRGRTQ